MGKLVAAQIILPVVATSRTMPVADCCKSPVNSREKAMLPPRESRVMWQRVLGRLTEQFQWPASKWIVMPPDSEVDLVAAIKALQTALGDNDLAKQVFSDANTADRQTKRDHFEARMEYVRQMAERSQATESSMKEYGLQTLNGCSCSMPAR
jgi:hypothetical protein